ncbi:asparagine synthase [Longimycelium tulufanense]|uniref:asparagine synthase (glutamine-hydrolyzing) n=1 Tax=Longimycelium tulufanense TaxID=907463 RepID=A0A8J3C8U0_9PSEU|nr:lasso peptide isopeptide bond-forming cyclase [Longimycelium tulufanense]GGM56323.1 asparagine synthase [Longimycelium tulufanense]
MPVRNEATGHGEEYFVVLPDHEAAFAVAPSLRAPRVVAHASGRPWLVGRWGESSLRVAETGPTRLAVLGCCPVTAEELRYEAERLGDLADLDRLARRLPGTFHLLAAHGGRLRAQGNAAGLRRVFHAMVGDITVLSDRADLLGGLAGAALDERQIAARLLWPAPHPLPETPLWRGVSGVPADCCVTVAADSRTTRVSRWWYPPEPTIALAEGAPRLREALATAVRVRAGAGGALSCDLSGGLDSTSICFLAGRDARVLASTWPGRDPADDDLAWARRAAAHLPAVEHLVWPAEESPLVYAGLLEIDDRLDEPTIGVMDRARVLCHLPRLAAHGSRLHLTGIGGDHIAWCSEAHYHDLVRRQPGFALRQLRGFRALFTWPTAGMLRALSDGRSYRRWLADSVRTLRAERPSSVQVALGWGMPPRLFDWVTPQAERAAREVILAAAEAAEPLAEGHGQHVDLEQILGCTRILRQWDQMAARVGLPMAHPFLDDRVVEAALAVRPDERVTPWQYKPLLVAAMRGIVPDECLRRRSKAQAAMDAAQGLREHRGDLLALWTDSRLAELGLVDAGRLRALAQRPDTPELQEAILYSTIACEVWLRALESSRTAPAPAAPTH